jgi:hypothetical protein
MIVSLTSMALEENGKEVQKLGVESVLAEEWSLLLGKGTTVLCSF